ncbi:MAG: flippase-like domain-containing protein, partial [Planctomycetes bacterium]|nr:flippase-like domain-containing protein [Planctomycetota bacterium]
MTDPANSTPSTAEPKKAGLPAWILPVAKVAFLGLAIWIVSQQVSWHDAVVLESGKKLRGSIHEAPGENPERLVLTDLEGTEHRLAPRSKTHPVVPEDHEGYQAGSRSFGIKTASRSLDPLYLLGGMLLIFGMYLMGISRWRYLLEAQGIECKWWRAFRLTFMGFFWNNFMPGMTGGDVAKAVLIAKDSPGRRSHAVSTVIVDRVIGLAVLALLSAVAILTNLETFKKQAVVVFAVLGACMIGGVCVLSRRIRRKLHISSVLKRMPASAVLLKLDESFRLYRSAPRALIAAVLLSVLAHACNIGSVWIYGRDLGIPASLTTYFATVPIILIAASVPLFPGGWGVREVGFITAFTAVGVPEAYKGKLVLLSVLLG